MAYGFQVYISLSEGPSSPLFPLPLSLVLRPQGDETLTSTDPESNDDFELLSEHPISSLDFDHVCVTAPDLPGSASADQNATLQLRYVAEYLDPNHEHRKRHTFTNETFYVCSDITLVPSDVFTFEIPCFNVSATEGHRGGDEEEGHHHDDEEGHHDEEQKEGGGGGLSKEAIAGVVIGCVVGVGVLATLGWYLWRRDRREAAVAREVVESGGK